VRGLAGRVMIFAKRKPLLVARPLFLSAAQRKVRTEIFLRVPTRRYAQANTPDLLAGGNQLTCDMKSYLCFGAIGVSGTVNFLLPAGMMLDNFFFGGTRLPYAKFPRNPSL